MLRQLEVVLVPNTIPSPTQTLPIPLLCPCPACPEYPLGPLFACACVSVGVGVGVYLWVWLYSNRMSGKGKVLTLELVFNKTKSDNLGSIKNLNLWGNEL